MRACSRRRALYVQECTYCWCSVQPCLEKEHLGRKQTLTYLRGYQHETPDLSGLMSSDGPARPSAARIPANYGSPKSAPGSPSASGLPKWVEQNGQVQSGNAMSCGCRPGVHGFRAAACSKGACSSDACRVAAGAHKPIWRHMQHHYCQPVHTVLSKFAENASICMQKASHRREQS